MKRLLLLTLALGAALAHAQSEAPSSLVLQVRDVEQTYAAASVVEAVRQATVAAQVTGRVIEVRADAGQRVRAGEVLMRIDAREAAEGVAGAQARLAQRVTDLDGELFAEPLQYWPRVDKERRARRR